MEPERSDCVWRGNLCQSTHDSQFCALLSQFWNYLLINWPICVSNVSCSVLNTFSVNLYEYSHICNCLALCSTALLLAWYFLKTRSTGNKAKNKSASGKNLFETLTTYVSLPTGAPYLNLYWEFDLVESWVCVAQECVSHCWLIGFCW